MPIKYVGTPIDHRGKTLFEILCNLKNLGVGRVVIRNTFKRYPEPTYYRIVRAEPKMDPANRLGKAWAEQIFRGVNFGVRPVNSCLVKDWQLLSKEEEQEMCKLPVETKPNMRIMPTTQPFPPLFKELLGRDRKAQGLPVDPDQQLQLIYFQGDLLRYRVAKEGETPTVELKKHASPELYEDVVSKS